MQPYNVDAVDNQNAAIGSPERYSGLGIVKEPWTIILFMRKTSHSLLNRQLLFSMQHLQC